MSEGEEELAWRAYLALLLTSFELGIYDFLKETKYSPSAPIMDACRREARGERETWTLQEYQEVGERVQAALMRMKGLGLVVQPKTWNGESNVWRRAPRRKMG